MGAPDRPLQKLLTTAWSLGALNGATPGDAFSVRCDASTMTQNDLDNGRLVAEIMFTAAATIELIRVTLALETDRMLPSSTTLPEAVSMSAGLLIPLHVFRFQVDFMSEDLQSGTASEPIAVSAAFAECMGLEATMEPKAIAEKKGVINYGVAQRAQYNELYHRHSQARDERGNPNLFNIFMAATTGLYAPRMQVTINVFNIDKLRRHGVAARIVQCRVLGKFADLNARRRRRSRHRRASSCPRRTLGDHPERARIVGCIRHADSAQQLRKSDADAASERRPDPRPFQPDDPNLRRRKLGAADRRPTRKARSLAAPL